MPRAGFALAAATSLLALALVPSTALAVPAQPTITASPTGTVTDPRTPQFTYSSTEDDVQFECKLDYQAGFFPCGGTGGVGDPHEVVLYNADNTTPPSGDADTDEAQYLFFIRPGARTFSVRANDGTDVSTAATSGPFTMDWNERSRLTWLNDADIELVAIDSNGNNAQWDNQAGIADALISSDFLFPSTNGYNPGDESFADFQEPSTRTFYFCAYNYYSGNPAVTFDFRIANDDAAETPQTGQRTLAGEEATYLGSSPPGLPQPAFLATTPQDNGSGKSACTGQLIAPDPPPPGGGGSSPPATAPGNPTSPINPAGNVRKRKCKKKGGASAAKKRCKKK